MPLSLVKEGKTNRKLNINCVEITRVLFGFLVIRKFVGVQLNMFLCGYVCIWMEMDYYFQKGIEVLIMHFSASVADFYLSLSCFPFLSLFLSSSSFLLLPFLSFLCSFSKCSWWHYLLRPPLQILTDGSGALAWRVPGRLQFALTPAPVFAAH